MIIPIKQILVEDEFIYNYNGQPDIRYPLDQTDIEIKKNEIREKFINENPIIGRLATTALDNEGKIGLGLGAIAGGLYLNHKYNPLNIMKNRRPQW